MKKISGIYQIKNLVNGKVYVGSAVNIAHRWHYHKSTLCLGKHDNEYLQHSWDKYEESNFCFEILEECPAEKLILFEQKWMDSLCSHDRRFGYNICAVAGSSLGTKQSEETKRKNSLSRRGEKNHAAKLTWARVYEIREKYLSGKYRHEDLSKEYGINNSNIQKIVRNESWKDESLTEEYFVRLATISKEANKKKGIFGEKNYNAKLNWEKVHEIREKYLTGAYSLGLLAKEYKVDRSIIHGVVGNRQWKDETLSDEYFKKVLEVSILHQKFRYPRHKS
jgi:group I intron endonuclease